MDVIDHTDYPGDDVPHAAKLLARRIAVANGPTGPYLVRDTCLDLQRWRGELALKEFTDGALA